MAMAIISQERLGQVMASGLGFIALAVETNSIKVT